MLRPGLGFHQIAAWLAGLPLRAILLLVWVAVAFGGTFFARDLQFTVAGWPLGFWYAAQGAMLFFVVLVALFAWLENRREAGGIVVPPNAAYLAYKRRLNRNFLLFVAGLLLFLALMTVAENLGLSKSWVGAIFLACTVSLYAVIGIYSRTVDAEEYYVAGRRIPAFYNGLATAADWMSAASFISLAGGLYLQGFSGAGNQPGGLAYVLGWTGGFCLVALLVAPHLRALDLYTVPDFFAHRYEGQWPRRIAALAAVVCAFSYVVAQIYGVGLITSRLTGVQFEIGILLGLGGVLVCSFLGGMRAVTWTQVTQYVVLILAFLIPVSWLAYKQLGNPLAPLVYGQQIERVTELEKQLKASPQEHQVIQEYAHRAQIYAMKLRDVGAALSADRELIQEKIRLLVEARADVDTVFLAKRELALLPKDIASAREVWTHAMQDNLARAKPLGGMPAHAQPFDGDPHGTPQERDTFELSRANFLALMFCLMVGTMGMPHLLTRFYTTPTVAEARTSVGWSLLFITLLYVAVPALAVMVKFEIMSHLVGQSFDSLPTWMAQWARVDSGLLSIQDVNGDHILQFAELKLGADIIMLATPELGGMPYVISGLVAAGGLAAALSTADALLLTIGNALAHDLTGQAHTPNRATSMRQVILSKFALLVVALVAAFVAAQRSSDILVLVTAAFSIAGAAFVPALVLGIFWSKATRPGAVSGMLAGVGITVYYMLINLSSLRAALHLSGTGLWWGIQPVSAGIFGVTAGFITTVVVSLFTQSGRGQGINPQIRL